MEPTPLAMGELAGIVIAAVASLLVAGYVAAYLLRNSPETFLKGRKLSDQETREPQEPIEE